MLQREYEKVRGLCAHPTRSRECPSVSTKFLALSSQTSLRSRLRIFGQRAERSVALVSPSAKAAHMVCKRREQAGAARGPSKSARGEQTRRAAGLTKVSSRIRQASDGEPGEPESSVSTRKATPARGKTLGRHVSAARRPDPRSGSAAADAPAREASVLDPAREERPHRACHLGLASGAAVGSHSPTTGPSGRQVTGRQLDWAR